MRTRHQKRFARGFHFDGLRAIDGTQVVQITRGFLAAVRRMGQRRGFGTETDALRKTESIGIISNLSKTRRVEPHRQRNLRYPVGQIADHLTTIDARARARAKRPVGHF